MIETGKANNNKISIIILVWILKSFKTPFCAPLKNKCQSELVED